MKNVNTIADVVTGGYVAGFKQELKEGLFAGAHYGFAQAEFYNQAKERGGCK